MKLIAVNVWVERYFDEESRPQVLTVRGEMR